MKLRTRNLFAAVFYISFVVSILTVTETAWANELLGTVAAAETFYGQLIISLIGAIPPTGMMIIAFVALQRGQQQMKVALDGKLDKLMAAEKGVSKAEGVKEEREENRARVNSIPVVAKVETVQPSESPVPIKDVNK